MQYLTNISEIIGKTPLLRLDNIKKQFSLNNNVFAKLEYLNPFGSVKDRIALSMINAAEKEGIIEKGKTTLIESSSGNTGIAIAAIGKLKGYKVVIVLPENVSIERRKIIKYFGADLIVVPKEIGRIGAFEKVKDLVKQNKNYVWLNQYKNLSNPKIHYQATANEIYQSLNGNIDIFLTGIGTGGTITGAGQYFKEKNKDIKVFGVEPFTKSQHKIEGLQPFRNTKDNFVPEILNLDFVDEIVEITDDEAYEKAKVLFDLEGIAAGVSSGANLAAAIKIDKKFQGKNIAFITQDSAFRYMSTRLFE